MEYTNTVVIDSTAREAELRYKELEVLKLQYDKIGTNMLNSVYELGELLIKAKNLLVHGKFLAEQNRWRTEGLVSFSQRSAGRYMLVAKHKVPIKLASVANLADAEKMASALEKETKNKSGKTRSSTPPRTVDIAVEFENLILKQMRKFPKQTEQREFLTELIRKLENRLQIL